MAVYVDDMRAPFGRMKMCHMAADSTNELLQMADAIGVHRKWIQKAGTVHEHFDVCLAMREKAVRLGAVQITYRQFGLLIHKKRAQSASDSRRTGGVNCS